MYQIREVANMTGLSSHTIRYYEKIGIIPPAQRSNGKDRMFTESNIEFIKFLLGLKETGMSLNDIKEIVDAGCLLEIDAFEKSQVILHRKKILSSHLKRLEEQQRQLIDVISATKNKLEVYDHFLDRESK